MNETSNWSRTTLWVDLQPYQLTNGGKWIRWRIWLKCKREFELLFLFLYFVGLRGELKFGGVEEYQVHSTHHENGSVHACQWSCIYCHPLFHHHGILLNVTAHSRHSLLFIPYFPDMHPYLIQPLKFVITTHIHTLYSSDAHHDNPIIVHPIQKFNTFYNYQRLDADPMTRIGFIKFELFIS